MYKNVNGQIIEMTEEEVDKITKESAISSVQSKYTQLTTEEVLKMLFKANPIKVDNETALRMKYYYPKWEELKGKRVDRGTKLTYKDTLYQTIQPVTPIDGQEPGIYTAALYEVIPEEYAGTIEEPVLYKIPMKLEKGKYYTDGVEMFLCTNDSGNPMTHPLNELANFVKPI